MREKSADFVSGVGVFGYAIFTSTLFDDPPGFSVRNFQAGTSSLHGLDAC